MASPLVDQQQGTTPRQELDPIARGRDRPSSRRRSPRGIAARSHPRAEKACARTPRAMIRWRRRCFDAILRWEVVMRGVFVTIPTVVFDRIEGVDSVVSFFFVYVMLQALAILWGFLFNVGAILGDNMISILTMPFVQALCVLITHISVIGIVLAFGRATWILTWQSTQNFPLIRRIIAYECRPQSVILVVALPMLVLLPSLIVVPSACSDIHHDSHPSWVKTVCEESYLKFLTDRHPMFQRSLRLATAIAIWQYIQACLEILPRWRGALAGMSTGWTFALASSLFMLNLIGITWTVEWIARHFKYHATPLSTLSASQWEVFGMTLLTAWILWFLLLTQQTTHNVYECEATQKKLHGLFERLKYSFVIGQAFIFFRACVHPEMGFVHAQLELTIINLLLPSIYVISLVLLRMVSLMSPKTMTITAPISVGLAGVVFAGSKMTEKPHSFFVLSLFFFQFSQRYSDAVSSLPHMGRVPALLHEMLQTTVSSKQAPLGHRAVRRMVFIAGFVLLLFVAVLSGFSVLSVVQSSVKWFPDATSVTYHGNTTIEIQHTAIVKLYLGLRNETVSSMSVATPRYASCLNKWNGLGIVDLALFAEAAYFDPLSHDISKFISSMFSTTALGDVEIRLPALNTKTGSKLDFYEAYIPAVNTSVIAVRGTDIWRFTDFIEDVKMFIEPVIFAILSAVFPTIRIWPDVTFSTLIELYSELISLFGLKHNYWYYHELLEYVASIKDRDVILTGHSMGGGIARLVGSIVEKTSVTFSPPGFVQSYSKLVHDIGGKSMKVDRANLHHRSVAIVPEYDPVTLIDAQAGMVQRISCNTPHLSMQLSCHMLEGTLCNLLEHCGDDRDQIASCAFEHHISSVTDDIVPKLSAVFVMPEMLVTITMIASVVLSILIRHRRKPSLQSQFLADTSSSTLPTPRPHSRGRQRLKTSKSASPRRNSHY